MYSHSTRIPLTGLVRWCIYRQHQLWCGILHNSRAVQRPLYSYVYCPLEYSTAIAACIICKLPLVTQVYLRKDPILTSVFTPKERLVLMADAVVTESCVWVMYVHQQTYCKHFHYKSLTQSVNRALSAACGVVSNDVYQGRFVKGALKRKSRSIITKVNVCDKQFTHYSFYVEQT